jgi:hypothetical protein
MRPRGFADWQPRQKSLDLLEQVKKIIDEYDVALTIRQIFYRLIGKYFYPKTEKDYKNLGEMLNRARRAKLIPMSAIRDDTSTNYYPRYWHDAADFWGDVRREAENFRLDRQKGQPRYLVVMCEAAGMAAQLFEVTEKYGIAVLSGGGFDSTEQKHRLGEDWAREGRPVCPLRIGDYDASGVAMNDNIAEDVGAFAQHYGGEIEPIVTVAITRKQAQSHNLPSAPPKERDHRPRHFTDTETWQAEALDPGDLARYLEDAILARFDLDIYEAVLAEEEEIRNELIAQLDDMGG